MLMRMFKNFHKDNRGFTLVELMVVVVIIGVLTAIAIPVYNESTEKAKAGACKANLRMLDSALQQYYMNQPGEEPDALTDDNVEEKLGKYFSDGFPECPGDGTGYTLSSGDIKTQHFECDGGTENHKHSYRNSDE